MESDLVIQNLNVKFGSLHILKEVNLQFPAGQITVVLGPSGCGKSTLLKSINRFIELEQSARLSGKIFLNQTDIYDSNVDINVLRRKVGLLAQRPFPLPMSIFDNVAYGMRLHHMYPEKQIPERVRHYLELAGLWEEVQGRLHAPATVLSIGQQQRLCLARGLAVEPDILLCDEPTSALDPISARHIEQRLLALKGEYTIILVTHVLRQAKRLADYVVFIYLGDVIEAGPAQQVFHSPLKEQTRAYFEGEI